MKDSKLAKEILRRVETEQKIRKASIGGKAKRSDYKKLDRQNSTWLKTLFAEHGWPTFSLIGKKAADGVWLMVQHADHDLTFQKSSLALMRKLFTRQPHEVSKMRIAYLTDRIRMNEKKPLIFGIMYKVDGLKVSPYPIQNPNEVNKRRKEFGIKTTVEGRRRALIRELKKLGAK